MIRMAKMADAPALLDLINYHGGRGMMLKKSPYEIYKNIALFVVYEKDGQILGCARLAIVWKDLAEVASLAVAPDQMRQGIGKQLVDAIIERAKEYGIPRLFALTYQCDFFKSCGFHEVGRDSLPHKVFGECLNCPKVECCDEHAFILDV